MEDLPGDRSGQIVTRSQQIAGELRAGIVSGRWRPGDQLPRRSDLVDTYGASMVTVQKALARLQDEGFVQPRGRLGTVVVDRPPHAHRIGLVFGDEPGGADWSRMCETFLEEAARLRRERGVDIVVYHKGLYHDTPQFAQLVEDAGNDCLAGLFVAGGQPERMQHTPIFTNPRLRRAALSRRRLPGTLSIDLRHVLELRRVIERFARERRQRPALIISHQLHDLVAVWKRNLSENGYDVAPYRIVSVHPNEGPTLRSLGYLLMRQPEADRPDAVMIMDDHMVKPVTQGIRDAGVDVPGDLHVAAHCNFPTRPVHDVPITCLGFDLRGTLERACDHLLGSGDGRARVEAVGPMFMDELDYADELSRRPEQLPHSPIMEPADVTTERGGT